MTIDEYVEKRIKELKEFKRQWASGHTRKSDWYPLDMPEKEWYAQEATWNDLDPESSR